jgi:adenylate cyclase class 2
MLEAEVKLALPPGDATLLRERIAGLGAAAPATHHQVDTYLAHPGRDFETTDEALRLRSEDGTLRVTYKGPRLDPPRKTREEIEFTLGTDHATAATLLERLGFTGVAQVAKTRVEWTLHDGYRVNVCIDEVHGLGSFCEIEVEAADVAEGRTRLAAVQARLGLAHLAPIAQSYLELLAARPR